MECITVRKDTKHKKLFFSKLLFTLMIVGIYAIMRNVYLYGVDYKKITEDSIDAGMILGQVVGGDIYKCSIMAIGLSPYMISSIIVQLLQFFKPSEMKMRVSPKEMNRFIAIISLILAIIMAVLRSNELIYVNDETIIFDKCIATLEMVTGSFIVIWLSMRNKKYGIGGQMAPIMVNVIDGIIVNITKCNSDKIGLLLIIGTGMMFIMLIMENTEKRIPVQRISIHNIYADKNYQAIKFNPVGIMPALFASAGFMLPQIIFKTISLNRPDDIRVKYIVDNMVLGKPLGIITYIIVLYLLNLIFSIIMVNPKDMSETFQRSGDSIVNLRSGKPTRRYLRRNILGICLFSSTIMSICLGGSLVLQMMGYFDGAAAMIPSSLMLLSGLGCTLYKESEAIINTDSYKPFI